MSDFEMRALLMALVGMEFEEALKVLKQELEAAHEEGFEEAKEMGLSADYE